LGGGGELTPSLILKAKNIPKEYDPSGIMSNCDEKGWMIEEPAQRAERSLGKRNTG
jgi:hypothetical protein